MEQPKPPNSGGFETEMLKEIVLELHNYYKECRVTVVKFVRILSLSLALLGAGRPLDFVLHGGK